MRIPLTFTATTSPRLRALQYAQLAIASLVVLASFITLVLPDRHKLFTFSLLYTPLLTSITTVFFITREQKRAEAGTLSKQKYAKYQMLKMASAFGMSIVGFIGYVSSAPAAADQDRQRPGEQGMWMNGVKIGTWQGMLLWLNFFNWCVVFISTNIMASRICVLTKM